MMFMVYACLLSLFAGAEHGSSEHVVTPAQSGKEKIEVSNQQFQQQVVMKINHLEHLLNQNKDENEGFKTQIQVLQQENTHLEYKLQSFEEIFYKELQRQNTFVTFRAHPSVARVYVDGDVLLFDNDAVNMGQHYNPESSIFVCPYDGYYMFAVTVLNGNGKLMRAAVKLEGSSLQIARAQDTVTDDQATVVVVTLCNKGQRVWVEADGVEPELHLYNGLFSTFSGTLLRIA